MKLPPEPTDNYQLWRKDVAVWAKLTDTAVEKRGLALQYACRHNKKLHEAVLNIEEAQVEGAEGLDHVLEVLDQLHNVDKRESAVACYKNFDTLKRKENQKVADFIILCQRKLKLMGIPCQMIIYVISYWKQRICLQ